MPANTTAIFSCSPGLPFPGGIAWSVFLPDLGKYNVEGVLPHSSILAKRGFTIYADFDFKYMNVSASEVNNGSYLICREYDMTRGLYANSNPAYLTVVGE